MPKTTLSKDDVKAMLLLVCDRVIAAEPQLSEADRNLGDGDHGLGMQRGMTAAKEKLNAGDVGSVEKAFSTVGMAMMSSMGGASGAIFGTFHLGPFLIPFIFGGINTRYGFSGSFVVLATVAILLGIGMLIGLRGAILSRPMEPAAA